MTLQKSNDIPQQELTRLFEKSFTSYFLSDVKKSIPKVNFKRIKLNKFQDLSNKFLKGNITKVTLDDNLQKINFPLVRVTKEEFENINLKNPLRKKTIKEEEEVSKAPPFFDTAIKEPKEEEKKDVTFNLEAQILEQEEPLILSPAIVSLPPLKEDILSSSGKQTAFVWPKVDKKEKKIIKSHTKKLKVKTRKKKKPYFIVPEQKPRELTLEDLSEKQKIEVKPQSPFPWIKEEKEDYKSFEDAVQLDLESSLVDAPVLEVKPELPPFVTPTPSLDKDILIHRAIQAVQPSILDNAPQYELAEFFLDKPGKTIPAMEIKEKGKVRQMSDKFENVRFAPIKIIILGGFVATVGYLLYGYFFSNLGFDLMQHGENNKLVVRDLFKDKHSYKKELSDQNGIKEDQGKFFKPITEEERQSLIQKAKEAIENRLDPFGQEAVLPRAVIEAQKAKEEEKVKPDIPFTRKQVELVGIISTKNSDLALLNVYTADYTVGPDDEKDIQESKLKAALTMAVPNRLELSVLDIVEGWYVKQIQRAKSRNEDPIIELVKEDKKFKLKVGQKVLLPEEKEVNEEQPQEEESQKEEG